MKTGNGFGSAGLGGGGAYIALKDDGDTATFYVPQGNEVTESLKVWEGGKSRDANESDDPSTIVRKFAVGVVTSDGKKMKLEQTNNFFKRFRAAVEKVNGDLYSHMWEVERIGEKGSTATTYRFVNKGKAPVPVVPTAAEIAAKNAAEEAAADKVFGCRTSDDERAEAFERA